MITSFCYGASPTSLGLGLGGVTCSGFGSAASAEGLSIRRIQRIHGVYGGIRSSTGSLVRFTSPYPSAGQTTAADPTQRQLFVCSDCFFFATTAPETDLEITVFVTIQAPERFQNFNDFHKSSFLFKQKSSFALVQ